MFEYLVNIPLGNVPVQTAIENELDSLKAAVKANDASLLELPSVIPLKKVGLE